MAVIARMEISKALISRHGTTITTFPHDAVFAVDLARDDTAPRFSARATQCITTHRHRRIRHYSITMLYRSVSTAVVCTHKEREFALFAWCELVVKHCILQRRHATPLRLYLALLTISIELLHRGNLTRFFPACRAHMQTQ
jgi:hypothetical protein